MEKRRKSPLDLVVSVRKAIVLIAFAVQGVSSAQPGEPVVSLTTVAKGLENPWAVAFLPQGQFLVTERPGRLRVITAQGR